MNKLLVLFLAMFCTTAMAVPMSSKHPSMAIVDIHYLNGTVVTRVRLAKVMNTLQSGSEGVIAPRILGTSDGSITSSYAGDTAVSANITNTYRADFDFVKPFVTQFLGKLPDVWKEVYISRLEKRYRYPGWCKQYPLLCEALYGPESLAYDGTPITKTKLGSDILAGNSLEPGYGGSGPVSGIMPKSLAIAFNSYQQSMPEFRNRLRTAVRKIIADTGANRGVVNIAVTVPKSGGYFNDIAGDKKAVSIVDSYVISSSGLEGHEKLGTDVTYIADVDGDMPDPVRSAVLEISSTDLTVLPQFTLGLGNPVPVRKSSVAWRVVSANKVIDEGAFDITNSSDLPEYDIEATDGMSGPERVVNSYRPYDLNNVLAYKHALNTMQNYLMSQIQRYQISAIQYSLYSRYAINPSLSRAKIDEMAIQPDQTCRSVRLAENVSFHLPVNGTQIQMTGATDQWFSNDVRAIVMRVEAQPVATNLEKSGVVLVKDFEFTPGSREHWDSFVKKLSQLVPDYTSYNLDANQFSWTQRGSEMVNYSGATSPVVFPTDQSKPENSTCWRE